MDLCFQAAADATPSGMVSVIGLDSAKVDEICAKACEMVGEEGAIKIANFLCPGNYAVSGSIPVRLWSCVLSDVLLLLLTMITIDDDDNDGDDDGDDDDDDDDENDDGYDDDDGDGDDDDGDDDDDDDDDNDGEDDDDNEEDGDDDDDNDDEDMVIEDIQDTFKP